VHTHIALAATERAVALTDRFGIDSMVNLSGGWPGEGLEDSMAAARAFPGRVIVFADPPLWRIDTDPALSKHLPAELEKAHQLGARGIKIFKALGLSIRDAKGALVAVDDARFDALFEKAGELGMPVAIHTGDPVAFWQEATPKNERYEELTVHPRWGYADAGMPDWETLFSGYEALVAKHPKTTFIGVHFGNAPEDPERVGKMLAKYPNLYVDTAARVPELGRRDPEKMRELFITYQDRILFGTDLGIGERQDDLMLGSTGAQPPRAADVERFFSSTFRWFETTDKAIPSPTPIQGKWNVDGIGLPREVLEKVYALNAEKLLEKAEPKPKPK
jgi:predicted TIM-barrel fold metal-dependent hydrolase